MQAIQSEQLDILVVDDDVPSASLIAELLRDEGYVVAESHQGTHALEAIQQRRPRLLITDVRMPGMDGFELARRVRQLVADIAVIFTSVQPENLMRVPAGNALGKPFQIDALLDLVNQNLPAPVGLAVV